MPSVKLIEVRVYDIYHGILEWKYFPKLLQGSSFFVALENTISNSSILRTLCLFLIHPYISNKNFLFGSIFGTKTYVLIYFTKERIPDLCIKA